MSQIQLGYFVNAAFEITSDAGLLACRELDG